MKLPILICLLFVGCTVTPAPISEFPGWSFQEVTSERFRVNVGSVKKDAWNEALVYAASLSAGRGFRAFAVMEEDGKGDSGTFFFWNQGYDGRGGMMSFSPGKYFTILCRAKAPTEYEKWFDTDSVLKQRPNQAPATPALRPSTAHL
jgi:hypothetical protein